MAWSSSWAEVAAIKPAISTISNLMVNNSVMLILMIESGFYTALVG